MAHVVVVGSQWGDEGKAKSSIGCRCAPMWWLAFRAAQCRSHIGYQWRGVQAVAPAIGYCARGQVVGHRQWRGGRSVGVLEEIDTLRAQGVAISPDNLKIAHNATLILPLHQELDAAREGANSGVKIGTPSAALARLTKTRWAGVRARC